MLLVHEVMGRNCGYLTGKSAFYYHRQLMARGQNRAWLKELGFFPERLDVHGVYVPEMTLDLDAEEKRLKAIMDKYGCVNVFVSEGAMLPLIVKDMEARGEPLVKDASATSSSTLSMSVSGSASVSARLLPPRRSSFRRAVTSLVLPLPMLTIFVSSRASAIMPSTVHYAVRVVLSAMISSMSASFVQSSLSVLRVVVHSTSTTHGSSSFLRRSVSLSLSSSTVSSLTTLVLLMLLLDLEDPFFSFSFCSSFQGHCFYIDD